MPAFGATSPGGDHGLARLDALGDRAELRRRAEEALRGLNPDPRPGARQEGTDDSNSVWVTVDAGGTVIDVSISSRWSDRMSGERLGAAVLQAYSRAHDKRVAAAALAALRGAHDGSTSEVPAEPYDPQMPDISDARWLGWVWQTLGEAGLRLDQLAAARPADAPHERTVAGPGGYVRLQVAGTAVTGVLVDSLRVAERQPEVIAADTRAAFAAARRAAPETRAAPEL
jgi:hypothetical protein